MNKLNDIINDVDELKLEDDCCLYISGGALAGYYSIGVVEALNKIGKPFHALIFGGIADKYHLAVHQSWWTVMERVKLRMRRFVELHKNTWFCFRISRSCCLWGRSIFRNI